MTRVLLLALLLPAACDTPPLTDDEHGLTVEDSTVAEPAAGEAPEEAEAPPRSPAN